MQPARGIGWFWWGLLLLCASLAWWLGAQQTSRQAAKQLATQQQRFVEQQQRLEDRVDALTAEIAQRELALDVAQGRADALQLELSETIAQSMQDSAELALYRRIASGEGAPGVRVERLELSDASPEELVLTLLQSQGRERASGQLAISFLKRDQGSWQRRTLGTDPEAGLLEIAGPGAQTAFDLPSIAEGEPLPPGIEPIAEFDLRFFQTLLFQVPGITTFNPEMAEVWILPERKDRQVTVQRIRWDGFSTADEQ